MCIICIKPVGMPLPDLECFKSAHVMNPHGAGFMVAHPDKQQVIIEKGFFDPYSMYEMANRTAERLKKTFEDLSMVLHWRLATHGSHSKGNCHPFPLTDDLASLKAETIQWFGPAMAHNGVFRIDVPRDERDLSDTQWGIMSLLSTLTFDEIEKASEDAIPILNSGRIVLLDPTGRLIRKGSWVEDKGCFWSNPSYWSFSSNRRRDIEDLEERYQFHDDCPDGLGYMDDDVECYVESGGGFCPECTGMNLDSGGYQSGDQPGVITRIVKCTDCGRHGKKNSRCPA
jgi:hypothetical protein